jgi:hypothetical protein
MICTGDLNKMRTVFENPVRYFLELNEGEMDMNALIGKEIRLTFTGIIHCVSCGKVTRKAFGQGFCYPCFTSSPLNSECIVRPELCEAHMGKGRDPEWEEENHNKPHLVYLALTSTAKVGVTREDQVPTRWIDQGAWKAIPIARTPYRQIAGQIEVNLKSGFPDKTPWQKMLKNEMDFNLNLLQEARKAFELFDPGYGDYILAEGQEIYEFIYPVNSYPSRVVSLSPEKNPEIFLTLTGIRGQYLIFGDQGVLNVRNCSGYEIELSV